MNEFAALTVTDMPRIRRTIGSDDLRTFLRARTADGHARLDGRLGAVASAPTADDHHRFILMNLVAYRALSRFVSSRSHGETGPVAAMTKAGLDRLENDARSMGIDCDGQLGFDLPSYQTPEAAGLAYVLEGSKLGAKVIHRRLVKAGLLAPETGISAVFLASAFEPTDRAPADRPGPMPIFAALASQVEDEDGPRGRAVNAAIATFALFERSLDHVVATRDKKESSR
ncbi:biliverdin-producing heme oxygenase [Jiella mangrovi]|uniref:Biliverdin-producing heme oxygenase n=1 Tax=Jiella mangrovi TaxID=2821407 RepID=A0ABS4BJ47_9HYPH|nr:biliverdin-producing heme oxygenase [Jiella mangrovi]MBP0616778.1 biliverdin-producing heme oxygenase [Jiella mangrovi]